MASKEPLVETARKWGSLIVGIAMFLVGGAARATLEYANKVNNFTALEKRVSLIEQQEKDRDLADKKTSARILRRVYRLDVGQTALICKLDHDGADCQKAVAGLGPPPPREDDSEE